MKKIVSIIILVAFAFSCTDETQIKPKAFENDVQVSDAMQHYASEAATD